MSISKRFFGALGLSLMAMGICLPSQAQTALTAEPTASSIVSESTEGFKPELAPLDAAPLDVAPVDSTVVADISLIEVPQDAQPLTAAEGFSLDDLRVEPKTTPKTTPEIAIAEPTLEADLGADLEADLETNLEADIAQPITEASELAYPATDEPAELAQARRRRTSGIRGNSNFIGIGADFGYADDLSFAVISKFEFTQQLAVRPTVLIADDFSILVPITYDFSGYGTDIGGFQLRPYAGAGVSYTSSNNDDDINLLLSAGVDVPLSERFTANAQVNWGILNDSNFGATVGIGYNLGNIFR